MSPCSSPSEIDTRASNILLRHEDPQCLYRPLQFSDTYLLLKTSWVPLLSRKRTFIHYESSPANFFHPQDTRINDHTDINIFPLSLQSKDHEQLLDVIDLLRSQGISRYVRLPQLIVCGDQSSEKSSVLEAVSGVRFPTKKHLCTRFATELVLRRDPTTNATVAIIPGAKRSDKEKEKLLDFKAPTILIDNFPSLIDDAKKAIGLESNARAFSDNVLRVEISRLEQPHLTLVDLPGLIHAESRHQSEKDIKLISSLIRSYITNTRSIILTVVLAKNDYANQIVIKLARDIDSKGVRTLDIIIKPNTLRVGSKSEKAFLDLTGNKDVVFRLGWHVLRNRDDNSRDSSVKERDEKEKEFFSQGSWISLPPKLLGIGALKPRLSIVLKDQIISELSNLLCDVETSINDSRSTLIRLGEARGTLQEQRLYLVHVSRSFSSLVKAAIDGVYVHKFFGVAITPIGFRKRLRAIVQDILLNFVEDIGYKGHSQEITEDDSPQNKISVSEKILRSNFLKYVRELIRRSRGYKLLGTFNPLIVEDLFYQQLRSWRRLLERYSERILNITKNTLKLILLHTTDKTTSDGLSRAIIDLAIEKYIA